MKKYCLLMSLFLCGLLFYATAKQIQVKASGHSFTPSSFSVAIGDTVAFIWVSGTHTTTSTSVPAGAASWNAPLDRNNPRFLYTIKVAGNYAFVCIPHQAMGMVGSFKVAAQTKTVVVKATSVNNCTSTNNLQYKCTQSKPPFKVQLFRYGKVYGSVRTVADTLPFTFSNLPIGSYYATARGNNGTDSLVGKSAVAVLMPVPAGVIAKNITSTRATIKWTPYTCVKFYSLQFRVQGVATWNTRNTAGNKDSLNLTGLTANTKYEYRVAAKDSANGIVATGKYTAIGTFTTKAALVIAAKDAQGNARKTGQTKDIRIYPNPANNSFTFQTNGERFISAQLRNAGGVVVWSATRNSLSDNRTLQINVSGMSAGTYFLLLVDINNKQRMEKIVIER